MTIADPGSRRLKALPPLTFEELRDTGMLWMINAAILHPRGFAMALSFEDDGRCSGWEIMGDGTGPWTYAEEMKGRVDECFAAFEAMLAERRRYRRHTYEHAEVLTIDPAVIDPSLEESGG